MATWCLFEMYASVGNECKAGLSVAHAQIHNLLLSTQRQASKVRAYPRGGWQCSNIQNPCPKVSTWIMKLWLSREILSGPCLRNHEIQKLCTFPIPDHLQVKLLREVNLSAINIEQHVLQETNACQTTKPLVAIARSQSVTCNLVPEHRPSSFQSSGDSQIRILDYCTHNMCRQSVNPRKLGNSSKSASEDVPRDAQTMRSIV